MSVRLPENTLVPFLKTLSKSSLLFNLYSKITFRLRGNVVAALVASSLQNVSAALGLHSASETVHLASLSFFRLVCSFHNNILFSFFLFSVL